MLSDSAQQKLIKTFWKELAERQSVVMEGGGGGKGKKKSGRGGRRAGGGSEKCVVLYSIPVDRLDMLVLG